MSRAGDGRGRRGVVKVKGERGARGPMLDAGFSMQDSRWESGGLDVGADS